MLALASAIFATTTLLSPFSGEAFNATPGYLATTPSQARYEPPSVQVWLSGDNVLRHGERTDVYFRTDDDAYVAVIRIDTDGRLHLLYPESPYRHGRVRGGRTYQASSGGYGSFVANEPSGLGFVFAMASNEPFDFSNLGFESAASFARFGHISGDPYYAIEDIADRLLDDRNAAYTLDFVEYHVGGRARYPRYARYDCYAPGFSIGWGLFNYGCRDYHVVYRDSYYYPDRYYDRRRVVYVREPRRPRYDFKSETTSRPGSTGSSYGYRERETNRDFRRPGSPVSDPNLPARQAASNPGATRPGDDVASGTGGRRRVVVGDQDTRERSGPDSRLPRRDGTDERSSNTPRQDGTEGGSSNVPRRDGTDGGSSNTPRQDSPAPERRSEPRRAQVEDRARRAEPSTERRRPAASKASPAARERKPASGGSAGESRRRRTPSNE